MHLSSRRRLRVAILFAVYGGCVFAARAADLPLSLGAVAGDGDQTRIYGVQASWTPPKANEFLERHDLGLRLTAQMARWVERDSGAQYHSLINAGMMAELRYWLTSPAVVRPFLEAGLGVELLSHVHIADRNMATAFNFGTQAAVGAIFGDNGRYEVSALIHHTSNGGIKKPNYGLTYGAIRFRVAVR